MAKIEIKGSPEELERVSTFLLNNNIKFSIANDFGNHSQYDAEKYAELMEKFNALWNPYCVWNLDFVIFFGPLDAITYFINVNIIA